MNKALEHYRDNGFKIVEGWVEDDIFTTIDYFNNLPINKTGGVCEIGVHHGKLFLLLNQITELQDKSYAIDVFESQSLNIDNSGCGNIHYFKHNLLNYDVHQGQNTTIIQGDSTDSKLQLDKIIEPGSLRFISIDGGHTAIHTMNDLRLASNLISNEGIVILDDILNHRWIGVLEGLVKFLQTTPTLVPVMMGHNKLYLVKLSYQNYYYEVCSKIGLPGVCSTNRFFGFNIATWPYWPKVMPW